MILSLGKTNRKEVNININQKGLPSQGPTCPLSILDLEQLPTAKTSETGPVSCKMSYYRIWVSLVICLSFWSSTFICQKLDTEDEKKTLIRPFLSCLVILQNVDPCVKHNNLFYYIYVITTITKCLHTFSCYYSLSFLLKSFRVDLGWH